MSAEDDDRPTPEPASVSALFEVAAGSVIGRDHAATGRNNQDAHCVWTGPEAVIAVVTDGCGSGRFSELGARFGARFVVEALRARCARPSLPSVGDLLDGVRRDLLAGLARLAAELGGRIEPTVAEHLLFTVLGAVLTDSGGFVFSAGDGVVAVNGVIEIVSAADNAPRYLAYGLLQGCRDDPSAPRFELRRAFPLSTVSSLLLGTDGVVDLLDAADRSLPGLPESVGPFRQFWEEARFFTNPDAVARRLRLANRTVHPIDWEEHRVRHHPGLLHDDTTLVVIRRRPQASGNGEGR